MNKSCLLFIDELNEHYCHLKKQSSDVDWQLSRINEIVINYSKTDPTKCMSAFIELINNPDHVITDYICESNIELIELCKAYVSYSEALNQYHVFLIELVKDNVRKSVKSDDCLKILKKTRLSFDYIKNEYEVKYTVTLNSADSVCLAYSDGLQITKERIECELEKIRNDAKAALNQSYDLNVSFSNNNLQNGELPEEMLIAKCPTGGTPCELMTDIKVNMDYKDIFIDLKNQGNVIVETDFEQTLDKELDQFVLAYIFRFIELFPNGMVNVHIFDRNPNKYNQRLYNIFRENSFSERARKTINLYDYSTLSELKDVSSVIVDDIFKKTSSAYNDLYSLHKIDKTDPFTLIVLRDGLVDQSGYSESTILETINLLTEPKECGHVCGIRFLIIDDSSSRVSKLNESNSFLIDSIKNNCSISLKYDSKEFFYQDQRVDVLFIKDNLDEFIQTRATGLAQRVTDLEKQIVSITELSTATASNINNSIFRIPVGKSGNSIVEIPLSCKDDNGTVDGQCIGFMVIGQSGSGKSSFFHSVVINGCFKYSPADLQFWLLDFKYGGASSKYKNSRIPHVRIVSENNKIDDALCLFQMIYDEMEHRNKLINSLSVDNIVEYNSNVDASLRLPRIVVMIDEVQEIFRDENASEIQRMISGISVRMRSVGMHFIMVAQNLSEGKSYMLKEAFLPSATGRICFRVAENMPRESGFDDSFIQRKSEISTLSTGEAYVSWGKDTIKKVKMAYASPDDMNNSLFNEIISKYPEYNDLKPMVIGSKRRLSINSMVQIGSWSYLEEFHKLNCDLGGYKAIIGEDAYRLSPLVLSFSPYEMSSLLVLGDDKNISSSICTSIALSLLNQNVKVHLFNADRQKGQYEGIANAHSFMYLCTQLKTNNDNMIPHSLSDFSTVLTDLYSEYIKRVDVVQTSDDEDAIEFDSIFLLVNDLFGIKAFQSNERISNSSSNSSAQPSAGGFDFSIIDKDLNKQDKTSFNDTVQNIVEALFKDGYNYNIYLVLALKGDPGNWRNIRPSEVNNILFFNTTQFVNQVDNQYFIKEMLKNISPDTGNETMAIWTNKKHISKIRPIIYDMSNQTEVGLINSLIGGEK